MSLPKPVGESKSGATRLSDLKSRKVQLDEPVPSGSSSKFFQPSTNRTSVARKTESIHVDLVFDDDTMQNQVNKDQALFPDQADTTTSDAAESAGTSIPPSPVCSTILSSPGKAQSQRADSPLSSPESSVGRVNRQRSPGGFTSPLEPNLDFFEADQQISFSCGMYVDAAAANRPPTPSPSDDAKDSLVIAPQTPEFRTAEALADGEHAQCETQHESMNEIDLTRFYPKEGLVTSPMEVISDIETDVEETQRETPKAVFRREKQEEQNVKAVAAAWKAKYTFGGLVSDKATVSLYRGTLTDRCYFSVFQSRASSWTPRNGSLKRKLTDEKENITPVPSRLVTSTEMRSAPQISREALTFQNASSGFGRTPRNRQESESGKRKIDLIAVADTPAMKKTRSSADVRTPAQSRALADRTNIDQPQQDRVLAPQSQISSPLAHSHSSPSVLSGSQKLLSFRYRG